MSYKSKQLFSIRKLKIGAASVLLGTVLFALAPGVQADEVLQTEPETVLDEQVKTISETTIIEQKPELMTEADEIISSEEIVSGKTMTENVVSTELSVEDTTPTEVELADSSLKTDEHETTIIDETEPTAETEEVVEDIEQEPELSAEELEKGPSNQTRTANDFLLRSTTARTARLSPSGTYHFTASAGIKAEPKMNSTTLATYSAGQSVNYDSVLDSDGHRWISYIAFSGLRRYVAVQKLSTTPPLTGADSIKNGVTAQLTQRGIELSITTNKVKDKSKILYAVWSDQKGQDDLHWYQADKSGKAVANYENHSGYGTYHIHTYTNETGRMVGLSTQTITIAKPSMTSTITKVNDSTFTIEVKVPHYMRDVKIPVWSTKNGQDDIKWYNATHQGNGTYTLTVSAQNHKSDLGQYQAHVYGNSLLENKRQVGLGRTQGFTVNRIVSPYTSPNARVDNSPNTYPVGECTWGVKQVASWASNRWGNANQWADNAQKDGFTIGTVPAKGAIIVMQHGNSSGPGYIYGHVGLVQNINPDGSLVILESNYNGRRYVGNHRGNYNHLRHEHGGWIKFIYPPS